MVIASCSLAVELRRVISAGSFAAWLSVSTKPPCDIATPQCHVVSCDNRYANDVDSVMSTLRRVAVDTKAPRAGPIDATHLKGPYTFFPGQQGRRFSPTVTVGMKIIGKISGRSTSSASFLSLVLCFKASRASRVPIQPKRNEGQRARAGA